ncbi:hypothetical protein ABZX95_17545 [Streptomyces sp. NPDC004232]|uniref:hypothetical protein n=1 Tax=Streptomyces sp. NPDC004232 TaxID=3154454 RepID=UPI0033BD27A9
MSAQLYGGISLDLNDGPIRTEYTRGFDGKPTARLILGEGTQSVAISVTASPAETLAQLQEAVAELAAWQQRQEMLHGLPEVA